MSTFRFGSAASKRVREVGEVMRTEREQRLRNKINRKPKKMTEDEEVGLRLHESEDYLKTQEDGVYGDDDAA